MSQDKLDKLLFRAVKKDDESAFEILFKLYYSSLCRRASLIVKEKMIAEELVSDFLLKVWISRKEINIHTTVKGYFYLAVRNASLNYLKLNKQQAVDINDLGSHLKSHNEEPLAAIISDEVIEDWEQKISKLPTQRQKVFRMNKLEGKRYEEIAKILSLSERTVRNHVQLAIQALSSMCVFIAGFF